MPGTTSPIYLDHNGTTPVAPEILDAMLPFLREEFGNASSTTPLGQRARAAVERARDQVAALIGALPDEITFTSGGTEASNHAIFGFAGSAPPSRRAIVTSAVEHPATEMPCRRLEAADFVVRRMPVDRAGVVDLDAAQRMIADDVALVTIIHAQNETGTLEPIGEIATMAKAVGAPIHVDASQSLGKVALDVRSWGVDAMTIAGHKLYAPKGIGALYLRRGRDPGGILFGAGQERGRRPGTENVPYIVALGEACRLAGLRQAADEQRLTALREALWQSLSRAIPDLIRVADGAPTLPNTLNVLFPDVVGNDLLAATPSIAASTGSTCHAGDSSPSSIILALGYAPRVALGAVRLTLGRMTTEAEIVTAARALVESWTALRAPATRSRTLAG